MNLFFFLLLFTAHTSRIFFRCSFVSCRPFFFSFAFFLVCLCVSECVYECGCRYVCLSTVYLYNFNSIFWCLFFCLVHFCSNSKIWLHFWTICLCYIYTYTHTCTAQRLASYRIEFHSMPFFTWPSL